MNLEQVLVVVIRDVLVILTEIVAMTRLETRTKESNVYASIIVKETSNNA